jgi:flagellar assembly protein FliH
MTAPHTRFQFDTVFDGEGVVSAPIRKSSFSPAEVEKIRADSIAEGERRMSMTLQGQTAQALGVIGQALNHCMPALAHAAHEHRELSARLSLAAAGKIADAALDRFPQAPVRAALESLAREIEAAPRLTVTVSEDTAEAVEQVLAQASETAAFTGQIIVRSDPGMPVAAFTFDWADGRAAYDPSEALERVSVALEAALAAEGRHAEHLSSDPHPSDPGADNG